MKDTLRRSLASWLLVALGAGAGAVSLGPAWERTRIRVPFRIEPPDEP